MEPTHDFRLLLAVLAPLAGALLVMAAGKRPNLREACSFLAALALFAITLSLVPDVLAGKKLHFSVFQLLPGLSVALRADAMSMIFAVSASFLWVVTVFYSAGYMRSLQEHAQTRFNACFALALFGAMGCAFADNLFTLYLFYEISRVFPQTPGGLLVAGGGGQRRLRGAQSPVRTRPAHTAAHAGGT